MKSVTQTRLEKDFSALLVALKDPVFKKLPLKELLLIAYCEGARFAVKEVKHVSNKRYKTR